MNKQIKVGINGFGRIGKIVFKILHERNIRVSMINDPFISMEFAEYTLTYDTTFGRSHFQIARKGNTILVDGIETEIQHKLSPEEIDWKDVDVVVEASGVFTTIDKCKGHLKTAKKVLITAPSADAPMFVMGVNHNDYKGEQIVSNASCTTNCLAPIAKILHDKFKIVEGLMTTVHAVTNSQKVVDSITKKDFRSGRSVYNIIPASTGAAKAVTKCIPDLKGKLTGMAFRVPVLNVSAVDLTVRLEKSTDLNEILGAVRTAKENEMNGIICYTNDEVVSTDYNKCKLSCVFDYNASMMLNPNFFKIVCWYDNEYGYSYRVSDMILHITKD